MASNRGVRARAVLALASSASRARAVGVGLRCFVPGIGAATLLKRSGTVMSIETIVMRPSTFGFWPSGPEIFNAMSAVAATVSFATTCACLPVRRMEPGKPAAGSSLTSPLAAIEPPSGVVPASRSMRILSPSA